MAPLPSIVDRFIPPGITSLEDRTAARSFVTACFGMSVLIALGLAGHFSLNDNPPPVRGVVFMCAAFFALPFTLRLTGSLRLGHWLFSTNVAVAPIAGALETGLGVHAPIMVIVAITPMLACSFLGRLGTGVFTGVAILSIGSAYTSMPDATSRLVDFPGTSASTSLALVLLTVASAGLVSVLDAERRALHEQMSDGEARFRVLAEDAADLVLRVQLAPKLALEYGNPAFERLVGQSIEAARADFGALLSRIIPADDLTMLKALEPARGGTHAQFRVCDADGRLLWLEAHASFKKDRDGRLVVTAICRDVTTRKQSETDLAYQALHDSLTGLRNRRAFDRLLSDAVTKERQSFALLFVDLDRFKPVNDELGHEVGDAVLRAVGKRLERAVRDLDVVCRIGGDEFAVLLDGAASEELAHRVAGRVVEALDTPIHVHGHAVRIGASVGIALCPEDGTTADELLKAADHAMYRAKRTGGRGFSMRPPRTLMESGIVETPTGRLILRDRRRTDSR